MGEEKKEEVENKGEAKEKVEQQEVKEKKQQEENDKKQEAPTADTIQEIVLKVDMHCEACARKVIRSLKGFEGVDEVKADYRASKVVVKLKDKTSVEPVKVCQRVHKKSGRKVELISPLPKPPPPDNLEAQQQQQQPPKQEEKKLEPPVVITVVLKVQMHCEACAQRLQKKIGRVKGVESVSTDISNNQVTVKGVLDPDKLVNDVYKRTRRHAFIVKNEEPVKEEKKDEAEKKDEKQDDKKQPEEAKEEDAAAADIKKNEHWPPSLYMGYYNYDHQMFSDENPNACSIM